MQQVLAGRGHTPHTHTPPPKVFIFPDAGGIINVEIFYLHSQLSSRATQGRMLTCQNSPSAPQSNMALWEGVFMGWKSLDPKPQRCSRVSLEWIPSQAHQGHSERLELQAKPELDNLLFGFLEQEKMSCPHFEFRYYSECVFNLIWFKQGLESQPPKSLK